MKICGRCRNKKKFSDFYKDKNRKGGIAFYCKVCNAKICKGYYKNNYREKLSFSQKKYREANSERAKVYAKKWRIENSEKIKTYSKIYRMENPEKIIAYGKKYHKENPEKSKGRSAKYRARKKNAFIISVNYQEIFIRDEGKCHICKKLVNPNSWHLDHIVPLSKNGTHEPKNVAVSHPKCNMQKGTREMAQLGLSS